MAKITFTDKITVNPNSSIPAINKVQSIDVNNLKSGINESTSYKILTQESAGKVYCTMTGTLATNDIINVVFPTLSTSTTMQISINGGTTYYYIKNMSADTVFNDFANTEITGMKATLFFDGTYFILDKSKYGGKVVTNINTITKDNDYTCFSTATGVPNSSYSWFITHRNSNVGTASAYQRAVAYSTSLIVYERTMQSGTWGNWILQNGEVIYSSTGTSGNLTLTKAIENYKYVEVIFHVLGVQFSTKANVDSSKAIGLFGKINQGTYFQENFKRIAISGTSVVSSYPGIIQTSYAGAFLWASSTIDEVMIMKIIGYEN